MWIHLCELTHKTPFQGGLTILQTLSYVKLQGVTLGKRKQVFRGVIFTY